MVRALAITAALCLAAAPALAQEAVPTAGGAGPRGAPDAAAAPGPLGSPEDIAAADPGPLMGPCGPTGADPKHPDQPDKRPHGEVFAGVGTNGYREGGGIICQPLGDHTAITIGVDAATIHGGRWRW